MYTEQWQAARSAAHQATEAQSARRTRIANLQRQIGELELDARMEESLAEPSGAANVPAIGAPKLRKEADLYRAEAARLRAELAGLDLLTASSEPAQKPARFT